MKRLHLILLLLGSVNYCWAQYEYNPKDLIVRNKVKFESREVFDSYFDNINRLNFESYTYDLKGNVSNAIFHTKTDTTYIYKEFKYFYDEQNRVIERMVIENKKDTTIIKYDPNDENKKYKPLYLDYGATRVYYENGLLKEESIGKNYHIIYKYEYY